ncbi:MAG: type I methionyl aminopeptidase [Acidimicrobiia bacterium]|nr:type I methionyl aminopeptidase [Acidimicrobiia bacterium]MDH3471213.1 type I methionyl aminopeptidase [Acidimicrobiia bacterium]
MITIKTAEDFAKMAAAGAVVAEVLATVREAAAVGVSMRELDTIGADIIRAANMAPSFLGYHGYPATICTSPNEVIVHGIPSDRQIAEGDIISVDAGAIHEGWHADAAITFAVGDVLPRVAELVSATEEALRAGIAQVQAGARLGDIGAAVAAVADRVGLGVVREYIGHGIGNEMHEEPQVPNYGVAGKGMKLKEGMAICIEPMFNLGGPETRTLDDGWTVVTADGEWSAHFEHTIAVTADGPLVLTAQTVSETAGDLS